MSEERALVNRMPDVTVWQMIMSVAPVARASRLFGVATDEMAAAIMLKGYELGFGPTTSFDFIHVIEGKPSLSPKGMLALIHGSGQLKGMNINDEQDTQGKPVACTVTMQRANGFEYTARFTMEDAKQAGIMKDRGAWDKYPANMLRWRAIGYCADVVFPDLCGGLLRPEELGAIVNAEGEPTVVEAEFSPLPIPQSQPPVVSPSPPGTPPTPQAASEESGGVSSPTSQSQDAPTLNDLVQRWTAPRIVQAFGGIPATEDQLLDTQTALEVWEANIDAVETAGVQNILDANDGKFPASLEVLASILEGLENADV